jgi:hypothetical protein
MRNFRENWPGLAMSLRGRVIQRKIARRNRAILMNFDSEEGALTILIRRFRP